MEPTTPTPTDNPAVVLAQALARRAELAGQLAQALDSKQRNEVDRLFDAVQDASRLVAQASAAWSGRPKNGSDREIEQLLSMVAQRASAADATVRARLAEAGAESVPDWLSRSVDPGAVADQLLAEPWDRNRDLLVLVGSGAEPLVRALVERGQQRIFVLGDEPAPEGSFHAAHLEDLEAQSWRLGWPYPRHFRVRQTGPCSHALSDVVARMQETLTAIDDFSRAVQGIGPKLIQAAARNARKLATLPSAHALTNLFPGVPAVIVSAGPSLDKNIHLLKELQGRAIIIGINQTVRALRRAGVQPDIVLACDYQNLAYHFEGMQPGELPFLGLGASVQPDLFELPAQHVFTFAASPVIEGWIYDLMDEDASLRAGGTVSISGLQLALRMGCSPIVVMGQDLALQGRKYYADGAADGGQPFKLTEDGKGLTLGSMESKLRLAPKGKEEEYRERFSKSVKLVEVAGYHGGTVQTTIDMHRQIVALRSHAYEAKDKAILVNATEGGAHLDGMEHLPLSEVIARWVREPVDVRDRLEAALANPGPERLERMRARMIALREALGEATRLARVCERRLERGKDRGSARKELAVHAGKVPFLPVLTLGEIRKAEQEATSSQATAQGLDEVERQLYQSVWRTGSPVAETLAEAVVDLSKSKGEAP